MFTWATILSPAIHLSTCPIMCGLLPGSVAAKIKKRREQETELDVDKIMPK